ncbi:hypothetical protein HY250_01060 [Candidatus Azambacteria bacterium]|nr:hypothetical protein [Candidatus Azambacteria bacterium]
MSFSSDGVKLHAQPKRNRAFLLSVRATEFILSVLFVIALAGWALVPEATQATAGVAKVLSYQGRLTDASGNPLGGSGTNYYLCFSIWDVSTGGTRNPNQLWPASYAVPTSMTVNVANGVFTADIGSGTDDLSTFNFYDNDTVYLNVEAASSNGTCGGSPFETLSPRQRIAATAYARVTRDVYGNLLRTDNANNKVQIGDPGGAPTTPIFLNLGVKTSTADGLLSWVGQSCSVNGALWYNSGLATPRVLLCENNLVKALSNATTTIDALSVTAANGNATFASGTVNFAAGNNITLSSGAQAITIHGAAGGAGLGGIAASNTTYTSGTILFTGSNNITISSSGAGQTVIVSGPNVHNVSLSGNNTAGVMAQISTGTMYLAGGNNIILSQNGNSVTISASSQSVQPVAISGSNGSFAFSTLTMGNLNGLSFYTSNGSLVGSYTAGGGGRRYVIPMGAVSPGYKHGGFKSCPGKHMVQHHQSPRCGCHKQSKSGKVI